MIQKRSGWREKNVPKMQPKRPSKFIQNVSKLKPDPPKESSLDPLGYPLGPSWAPLSSGNLSLSRPEAFLGAVPRPSWGHLGLAWRPPRRPQGGSGRILGRPHASSGAPGPKFRTRLRRTVLEINSCEMFNDFSSFFGLLGRDKKPHRYYDYNSFGPSGVSGAEWFHPVILEATWAIF